jgi:hypothetical protein
MPSAARIQGQVHVYGSVPDTVKVKGYGRCRAARTACGRPELPRGERIEQSGGIHGYRCAAANHPAAPLILVYRQVDSGMEKGPERTFHPIAAHEALHIAVLAACYLHEPSIWVRTICENDFSNQFQKIVITPPESQAEDRTAFPYGERVSEVAR